MAKYTKTSVQIEPEHLATLDSLLNHLNLTRSEKLRLVLALGIKVISSADIHHRPEVFTVETEEGINYEV